MLSAENSFKMNLSVLNVGKHFTHIFATASKFVFIKLYDPFPIRWYDVLCTIYFHNAFYSVFMSLMFVIVLQML